MVRRLAIVLVITAVVVLGAAMPAWAHVAIAPSEAPAASDATLAFQVPNECDGTTTKFEVHFPEGDDEVIASADVLPVSGWTAKVNTESITTPVTNDEGESFDSRVSSVVWTADGAGIAEEQFQAFTIRVGLPDKEGDLLFPSTQSCSDGKTLEWNQASTGGEEAEDPAPTLTLTAGESDGGSTTPTTAASSGTGAKAGEAASASGAVKDAQDDADNAKTLGIISLILGVIALIVGIVAMAASRRRTNV
jgi:uncharacterized protein YcnI